MYTSTTALEALICEEIPLFVWPWTSKLNYIFTYFFFTIFPLIAKSLIYIPSFQNQLIDFLSSSSKIPR